MSERQDLILPPLSISAALLTVHQDPTDTAKLPQHPTNKPKLPPLIPCVEAGTMDFETGFSSKDVFPSGNIDFFLCPVCMCVPRAPVHLEKCGHVYCTVCLVEWGNRAPTKYQCAVCRQHYMDSDVIPFPLTNPLLARIFKTIVVRCPNKCGFTENPCVVSYHQVSECPKRRILCPNEGCPVVMQASNLETDHYPNCPKHRVYCTNCRLPVLLSQLNNHSCLERMRQAFGEFRKTSSGEEPFGEPLKFVVPKVQSASDRNATHRPKLMRQNATLGMEFPNIAQ